MSWLMLFVLLVPFSVAINTVVLQTVSGNQETVLADRKNHRQTKPSKPKKGSDGNKDKNDKNKDKGKSSGSSAASSTPSNKGNTSDTAKGNILDQPASELAQDANKDMTTDEWKDLKPDDKSGHNKASLKSINIGADGNYEVGQAWSFMAADNQGIWSLDNQGNAGFNVAVRSDHQLTHFPTPQGKNAYHSMVNAVHLAYVMNQLGLDNSFSKGFNGQKHNIIMVGAANLMQLCYGLTNFVHTAFTYVLKLLNDFNPFELAIGKVSGDSTHFGPIADIMRHIYDSGTNFGKMIAALILCLGIGLAAMGMQVGQSAQISQGRGIVSAGIDGLKRFFVVLALPIVLIVAYSDLLKFSSTLFNDAGVSPGNYAIYSTMTSFEDMVTHGRLNFSPTLLNNGLLPNEDDAISSSKVTNAYINHRTTLLVNADFGRSGAEALKDATAGGDSTESMFKADTGKADGKNSAMQMLKDFAGNRTYDSSDYVSQVMPGIKSKTKDDDKNKDDSQPDLTDPKAITYSANGALYSDGSHFLIHGNASGPMGDVQGNSTVSNAGDLAVGVGGLSTIGMYNYMRSISNQSSIDISSPYKHSNDVADPQHYAVNFAGSGSVVYANIFFAFAMMLSMAEIALGTLWFVIKALMDAIPGSFSGIISSSMGSLTGATKAVGALVGFFIALAVTGLMYQLSFRALVAFIGSVESYFGSNTGAGAGDAMTGGVISLLGMHHAGAPVQVAGLISLNAESFAALTMAEAVMMLYLVHLFFKWRHQLIQSLSAMANVGFSRIMQSFGSLTGKGSSGMQYAGMEEQAARAGDSGIGALKQNAMGAIGMMNRMSGGGLGKAAKGLGLTVGTGLATGAAMKGLSSLASKTNHAGNNSKSLKNSHAKSDQHNHMNNPKSAEEARQQAALQDLEARRGDPLNFTNPMANTDGRQSLKGDQKAKQNSGQNALNNMDKQFSDQGRMEQMAAGAAVAGAGQVDPLSYGVGQGNNPMANMNNAMSNTSNTVNGQPDQNSALAQVLAASGVQDPMADLSNNIQGQKPNQLDKRYKPASKNLSQKDAVNNPNFDNQNMLNANGMTAVSQGDVLQDIGSNQIMGNSTIADTGVADQGDVMGDSSIGADGMPTDTSGADMMSTDSGVQSQVGSVDNNGIPIADTDQQNSLNTQSSPLTDSQADTVANKTNQVLGTNFSGSDLQQIAPEVSNGISGVMNSFDSTISDNSNGVAGAGGGTTVTATGNGQAVVSQTPGINSNEAFGKGLGVMPGNVPIGMSVDPSYTSSGAGVIHGGLNTALGNVQNANTRVVQANNAVRANPTNTILQQRATQALQDQRNAQVQAMQMFNKTPARQTMGSLMNANTPSTVSTGTVNQAVSEVYAKQQAFKQAATKFGPTASQTQQAAQQYQQAVNSAQRVHVKSQILKRPEVLHQAFKQVRKQQMSVMDGTFKL